MQVTPTKLDGAVIIEPDVFGDDRGYFLIPFEAERFRRHGLPVHFVQDNVSYSTRGTLRGLHFQNPHPQGKLVMVLDGSVFDVIVDIRTGSPTFGQWEGVTLTKDNHRQVYIPPGFAHGFCVTSESALFAYKVTERYAPEAETTIAWNDPELAIDWPVTEPILSAKDRDARPLSSIEADKLRFD